MEGQARPRRTSRYFCCVITRTAVNLMLFDSDATFSSMAPIENDVRADGY